MKQRLLIVMIIMLGTATVAQQISDIYFNPEIKNPGFPEGKGPIVFLDEGHNNFHKLEGRYKPFAILLRRDGFVLKSSTSEITSELLKKCSIFIISDPMSKKK
ncbi:hypothetical protein ACFLSI_01135 [Bacteroidota bacterium]